MRTQVNQNRVDNLLVNGYSVNQYRFNQSGEHASEGMRDCGHEELREREGSIRVRD